MTNAADSKTRTPRRVRDALEPALLPMAKQNRGLPHQAALRKICTYQVTKIHEAQSRRQAKLRARHCSAGIAIRRAAKSPC